MTPLEVRMAKGNVSEGGLSLGRRVQTLEKKVSRQEQELKRRGCGEEEHYLRLLGKVVLVELVGEKEIRGKLLEVSRFTVLIETESGEKTLNKGHIICMSRAR